MGSYDYYTVITVMIIMTNSLRVHHNVRHTILYFINSY